MAVDFLDLSVLKQLLVRSKVFLLLKFPAELFAGTNLFINGSPYSWLHYNEPMSTGRRIAREIKNAIETDKLDLILD